MLKKDDSIERLPYVFDLLWDIKTKEQLIKLVSQMEEDLTSIKEEMKKYNIKL